MIPGMTTPAPAPYEFTDVSVIRVVDGDTVHLQLRKEFNLPVDFGFYITDNVILMKSANLDFRLKGINAPEMKGATLEKGKAAKDYLTKLLAMGILRALTFKQDKYGRWLVQLYVRTPDGVERDVNQEMVSAGFAVPYMVDG
jgi:endonuclease YncB( thermonuclease family)